MKKLKIALIMLLATFMSVGLFACGGSEEDDPGPGPGPGPDPDTDTRKVTGVSLYQSSIDFTDADGEDDWKEKAGDIQVRVTYNRGYENKKVSDCICDLSDVQWGTVGTYSVEVTYSLNDTSESDKLEVVIDHDFGEADANHMETCSVDGATRVTTELNATLNFKNFHARDGKYDLKDSTGSIMPFGAVQTASGAQEVKTTTVGRLEKGMTITIYGTAENKSLEEQYYFPILGFADTSVGGPYTTDVGNAYGTGVFVRNEGWVLYNGVGEPRLLAAYAGGISEGKNYGSHPSDQDKHPEGFVEDTDGYGPSDWTKWMPWHVYSYGTISRSGAYAVEGGVPVKFSWSYYDIDQAGYGLIVLTYYMLNDDGTVDTSLTCRAKVPDSPNGYYDSILHGEYVDMTFNKIQTVQTTTLKEIFYEGIEGTKTEYLENEYLDFSTLKVYRTTEQSPDSPERDTQFDVQANVGGNWVSLRTTPLSQSMTEFRIHRVSGNVELNVPLDDTVLSDTVKFITIKKNAVDVAYGYPYAGTNVNETIGQITVSSTVESGKTYASLTFPGTAVASSANGKKFVSFRLWARENGTKFYNATTTNENLALTCGGETLTPNTDYEITFAEDGSYVDVLLYFTDKVQGKVFLNGLVAPDAANKAAADVVVDVSNVACTKTVSTVDTHQIDLLTGGTVTITYQIDDAAWAKGEDDLGTTEIYVNTDSALFDEDGTFNGKIGNTQVAASIDSSAKTVTVEYTLPGVTATNVTSYNLILNFSNGNGGAEKVAEDTVYYDMESLAEKADTAKGIVKDGYYVTANGATLYILKNFDSTNVQEDLIKATTLNLNVNAGTVESLNVLDLSYEYKNGEFVFNDVSVSDIATGTLKVFGGSFGNAYDYDRGAVAVIAVDLSKVETLGKSFNAPYYFELNATAPDICLVSAENVVSRVEANGLTNEVIIEGNCLVSGYQGSLYEGEAGNFYTNITPIGGDHQWPNGNDGSFCNLCGAKHERTRAFPATATLENNQYLQLNGTYTEAARKETYNGMRLQITVGDDFYWIRCDALVGKNGYTFSSAEEIWHSYTPNGEDVTLRTPNGKLSLIDGSEITTDSFKQALSGGSFFYTVTYENGVITVFEQLFVKDNSATPYTEWTTKISGITAREIKVEYGLDQSPISGSGNIWYVKSDIVKSSVSSIDTAENITVKEVAFNGNAGTTYVVGNVVNSMIGVRGTGKAVALSDDQKTALGTDLSHYIAFTVKMNKQLANVQAVKVKDANGNVIAKAVTQWNGNNLEVVIPTDGTVTNYVLDFVTSNANSFQGDIALDLSNVTVSTVVETVTGLDGLNLITGGEFTVTYTGLNTEATIRIGEDEADFNTLENRTAFAGIFTVKSKEGNAVTFTVSAPDLTAPLTLYTIELLTKDGKMLSSVDIDLTNIPDSSAHGVKIDETTYANAEGNALTLVLLGGATGDNTLTLNANNGAAIGAENLGLIQAYDLTYRISVSGVSFKAGNLLTDNTELYFSEVNGKNVVVAVVDLTAMNIAEGGVYAFEVPSKNAAPETETAVYTVSAERAITSDTKMIDNTAREVVSASTCTSVGVSAQTVMDNGAIIFYYNIAIVSPSHTWASHEKDITRFECSVCHAVLGSGNVTKASMPAMPKIGEESIVDTGITISYVNTNTADGEWAQSIATAGGINFALLCLDPYWNSVNNLADATQEMKALATKLYKTNCWPGMGGGLTPLGSGCFVGTSSYMTLTISVADGIRAYKDGVFAFNYAANAGLNVSDATDKTGTVADFAKLFLLMVEKYGFTFGSGVQAKDALVQRGVLDATQVQDRYNLYLVEKDYLPVPHEHTYGSDHRCTQCNTLDPRYDFPTYTTDTSFTLGTDGTQDGVNWTGYTPDTGKYFKVEQGKKLTIEAGMKSPATENYHAPLVAIFSGKAKVAGIFRGDNFTIDGDALKANEGWSIAASHTHSGASPTWADFRAIIADCTFTLEIDWTNTGKIVVKETFTKTGDTSKVAVQTYTITPASGKTFLEQYSMELAFESCYLSVTSVTTAEA